MLFWGISFLVVYVSGVVVLVWVKFFELIVY